MTNCKKRIIKHTVGILILLILTAATELIVFNSNAITNKTYSHNYTLNGRNGYTYDKYESDEQYIFQLNTDGEYIHKLYIRFKSNVDFSYVINVLNRDEKGINQLEKIDDDCFKEFTSAVSIVDTKADKIIINIDKSQFKTLENGLVSSPVISRITVSNEMDINKFRVIFILAFFVIVYLILVCRNTVDNHLEIAFFVISMAMGIGIITLSPNKFKSWDEEIHFNRAYVSSSSDEVYYEKGMYLLRALKIPEVNTMEERDYTSTLISNSGEIVEYKKKDSDFIKYDYRAYLPHVLGLKIGTTLGLPLAKTIWLAKLFGLLCYSLVMALAIKLAKIGKRILLCIGLLPTSVFLASTFSYDAFVTAFLMLGFVCIINEITDKEKKLNWKNIAVAVGAIIIGSFSKAVYVPMIILLCFLPKEKYANKKQRVMFIISIVAVFLVMMSTFVLPALSNVVSNVEDVADTRGGDTSVTRQISFILEDPAAYVKLLGSSILGSIGEYFVGYRSRTSFGYMGQNTENLYLLSVLIMIVVTITGETKNKINARLKILLGIMLFGIAVLIWTALYLSFTPVGANVINGVQARYYIPLMLPMMMIFFSKKIQCTWNSLKYNRIMLIANLSVLAGCVYSLVLLPFCS